MLIGAMYESDPCPRCGYNHLRRDSPDECPSCLGAAAYAAGQPLEAPADYGAVWSATWRVAWKRACRRAGCVVPGTEPVLQPALPGMEG